MGLTNLIRAHTYPIYKPKTNIDKWRLYTCSFLRIISLLLIKTLTMSSSFAL